MSITFIHTADVHIGMKFTTSKLDQDISKNKRIEIIDTFLNIVKRCKNKKIDFLFIAGDLFEDELCTIADLKIINDSFKDIKDTNIIIITGNHDYLNDKSLYNLIDWSQNVYIIKEKNLSKLSFEKYNTDIWGLSWYEKEKSTQSFKDIKLNKDRNNILLLHGDIIDKKSKYMPIDKNHLKNLEFDYIGLGHIHKHQYISNNICYCGSPEPLDFGETGDHGVIEGLIDKNGLETKFIPLSNRRYHVKTLNINENMTYNDILDNVINVGDDEAVQKDFFRIILNGFIDKDIKPKIKELEYKLKDKFYFIKIIDNTKENYDLEGLLKDNKENIIGRYIIEMKDKDLENETITNALIIGLEELLREKGI